MKAEGFASAGLDLGGSFIHLAGGARCGNHIGAGLGKTKAEGAADAGGSSGYDRDFSFKTQNPSDHVLLSFYGQPTCRMRGAVQARSRVAAQENGSDVPVGRGSRSRFWR